MARAGPTRPSVRWPASFADRARMLAVGLDIAARSGGGTATGYAHGGAE